jgi:hypothetical protein
MQPIDAGVLELSAYDNFHPRIGDGVSKLAIIAKNGHRVQLSA